MRTKVNQLVHGYRRGHQLLAGSVRLEPKSADLVARLSDLSGSSSADTKIRPYLTAYPLPSGQYYALARTWLDEDAPRDGCVLTHTLLIEPEFWASFPDPRLLAGLFTQPPSVEHTDAYRTVMEFSGATPPETPLRAPRPDVSVEFVAKYFGEGLRPIVWFEEPHPDDLFWFVVRALWPNLRREFACCTLSLQPRTLEDRPFDLLLAPLTAHSRFLKVPRENVLDTLPTSDVARPPGKGGEPWHRGFAKYIFGGQASSRVITGDADQLSQLLTKDPTAIRSLFLIETLHKRISESPTASIGLMDLVETIAPAGTQATAYKRSLLTAALHAASEVSDTSEALKCFFLIGERLGNAAFKEVLAEVEQQLYSGVARRTAENPEAALNVGERLFAPHVSSAESVYARGVIEGLLKLVSADSTRLAVLHRFPVVAASIVTSEPLIARGYLRGMKARRESSTAETDLVAWLAASDDAAARVRLQTALLPEVEGDDEICLAEELLAYVDESSYKGILETLNRTTHGFSSRRIRQIVAERISRVYPEGVSKWGGTLKTWSEGVTEIVAAAYPEDAGGFSSALRDFAGSGERRAQVVGAYLITITARGLPLWFREYVRRDSAFLVPLLEFAEKLPPNVSIVVEKILEEVRDIPVALSELPVDKVADLYGLPFTDILRDRILRSAISGYVKGSVTWEACNTWQSQQWAAPWFGKVERWDLEALVTANSFDDPDQWARAWGWTSEAPEALYRRSSDVLPRLTESLITGRRRTWGWGNNLTESWIVMLRRTSASRQNLIHVHLCTRALDYAFEHRNFPLGGVVAESFAKVYTTILNDPSVSPLTSIIFGILSWIDSDWDKGKDLRKKLVESFMDSTWDPGDLALAASDVGLVRKIFKRVQRHSEGEVYIAAMLKDLRRRDDPRAKQVLSDLEGLARNPNFSESWD